ncbi:hypothetical protein [Streptomyces sp. NPDC020141]|uniref:hypothetical protein n=1 Tax=Streptomyces sp. NPDC020141 TaxID=3365065 RepID=UPI003797C2CB
MPHDRDAEPDGLDRAGPPGEAVDPRATGRAGWAARPPVRGGGPRRRSLESFLRPRRSLQPLSLVALAKSAGQGRQVPVRHDVTGSAEDHVEIVRSLLVI